MTEAPATLTLTAGTVCRTQVDSFVLFLEWAELVFDTNSTLLARAPGGNVFLFDLLSLAQLLD